MAALPELQREALVRTAVHGESHEQVASALGLSDSAVRGLIYRARATLRTALTAITPPQFALWAARAASTPTADQLGVAGGGSLGIAGVLGKGGAALMAGGVLATGTVAVHPPKRVEPGHSVGIATHSTAGSADHRGFVASARVSPQPFNPLGSAPRARHEAGHSGHSRRPRGSHGHRDEHETAVRRDDGYSAGPDHESEQGREGADLRGTDGRGEAGGGRSDGHRGGPGPRLPRSDGRGVRGGGPSTSTAESTGSRDLSRADASNDKQANGHERPEGDSK